MFKGLFAASLFFKLSTYVIIPTLILIYQLSQLYDHQKPFPHCWISKCAQHYPEYVVWRMAAIPGPVLVILGWLTNYFYLNTICKDKSFNLSIYFPAIPTIMGIMGAMLLMGSTATIDTGKMNDKWHDNLSTQFFVVTFLALIYNTVINWIIYIRIKTLKLPNLIFKTFVIGMLCVQLYISSRYESGFFWEWTEEVKSSPNTTAQFLEWTLTSTVIAGYYSMGLDVQNFKFVYQSKHQLGNSSLSQVQ